MLFLLHTPSLISLNNSTRHPLASDKSGSKPTMTFDKTKAMRNAEKYLAQGKLRAAISEYEQVVKFDSRDFGTINMLGDLYSKSTDAQSAIRCYTAVADHYGKQGFAHKAIAVYNKISRLDPNRIEVWQNLAELYKQKGSLKEARTHFKKVADHHEKRGNKLEALAMWKEIALLDPTDTAAYASLAESYLAEDQLDEALDAYAEVGRRFANRNEHEQAVAAYEKALAINKSDVRVLTGFVTSQSSLGRARQTAERLTDILVEFPHSREIRFLLIDCLIEAGEIAEAEKAVIKLVEMEPANYPKFLELAHIYIDRGDLDAATRILSMSSEHMLVGGQAEEFSSLVRAVLDKDPDQLDALRLQARYCSWQRDEDALCKALAKLAQVAKDKDSVEDERYALLQLTMLIPHDVGYNERLREINAEHGFDDGVTESSLFDKQFLKNGNGTPTVPAEVVSAEWEAQSNFEFAVQAEEPVADFAFVGEVAEVAEPAENVPDPRSAFATAADLHRLQKEIEGIRFYIDNGYLELAEKAANELRGEFGDKEEVATLIAEIQSLNSAVAGVEESEPQPASAEPAKAIGIEDLRSELGLEEAGQTDDSDYETCFNTATAYKEMGLVEQAIKEFQQAASLTKPNDGTRRFFECSNMLGLCFMEQGMPHLALKWFERTLETANLASEEKQGIWYELASAYEASGDAGRAGQFFEQVYSENANFRDVSERIKSLVVNQ